MSDLFNSETFWLDTTNVILGAVTVICLVIVAVPFYKEVLARIAIRARVPLAIDSHAFDLSDLGITMADGGTRIDETTKNKRILPGEASDPENIYRSNN